MPIRIASHLYRNQHGTLYFRFVIPESLRTFVGRSEVRFSLYTDHRHTAIITALPLIADLPRLLDCIQRMSEKNEKLPPDYFKQWRELLFTNVGLKWKIKFLQRELEDAREAASEMFTRSKVKLIGRVMHERGQLRGKQELEERLVFPWPADKTVHFSELLAAYMKSFSFRPEGGNKKPPLAKTLEGYGKDIYFFITVMSDVHIGAIDRDVAGEYFNILRKLPPNISRISKYRGKSVLELLAIKDPPQSEYNASKKMERVSGMFKWALLENRRWGIDGNPFVGYSQSGDLATKRRPFTNAEMQSLLSHPDFLKRQFSSTYSYWLIPLAVFTGARLGELAQLDLKDFVVIEGIDCIDINDVEATEYLEVEGMRKKGVKTKNANRLVPIHPQLIRLGLLRYVELKRTQKQIYMFPELSRTRRDGPAHAASNWFGRFRKRVGIDLKQETVFHSFRHGFITNLLDAGISPYLVAPIVGHEAELITGKVYWNIKDAAKRKLVIDVFSLKDDVLDLLPIVENVTFLTPRRPGRTPKTFVQK